MSEYEGCYVKLAEDATFWLVEDGERWAMASAEEMLRNGLRMVVTVTAEEMEAIPIKGTRRSQGGAISVGLHVEREGREVFIPHSDKEEEKEG